MKLDECRVLTTLFWGRVLSKNEQVIESVKKSDVVADTNMRATTSAIWC
ncbi:hypothetical protein SAMN05443245_6194 [Paraburkholderia fungorum]|uniref:Uncharacterized protein n=1 Tax=Paraburkholderia fungorum TaxID=134537 RepID=A0A1H1JEM5_9BURK|nr:hypothetical protein [Paraburkholderia fungorum]SDR48385.1 hypothetical protein SAMN05443245_6194 [Paraburkholderia fungorum]